jgi:predicted ATPase
MTTKNLYIISGCNGAGKTTASYTVLPIIGRYLITARPRVRILLLEAKVPMWRYSIVHYMKIY